jgi:hypothetical protein
MDSRIEMIQSRDEVVKVIATNHFYEKLIR